jgi:CBS domain-containing protein
MTTEADRNLAILTANAETAHLDRPRYVETIMTAEAARCSPDESLAQCARTMWERRCGAVVVVDDADRPIAVVTDRDIAMAAYIQGKALDAIPTRTAMSERLFTVHRRQSVWTAEGIMRRAQVRRLPVVDDDQRLIGILSIDDIALHVSRSTHRAGEGLAPETVAATVAALSHARQPAQ